MSIWTRDERYMLRGAHYHMRVSASASVRARQKATKQEWPGRRVRREVSRRAKISFGAVFGGVYGSRLFWRSKAAGVKCLS